MPHGSTTGEEEKTLEFELSEAPIHRIQTLATIFSDSVKRIKGFEKAGNAMFVRRDFDSPNSEDGIIFNATFYREDVVEQFKKATSGYEELKFSLEALEALKEAGLNKKKTPRYALDRSVEQIKKWSLKKQSDVNLISLTNSWLELYSRAAYKGGLPGFIAEKYSESKKLPSILLCAVKLVKKGPTTKDDFYEDTLWTTSLQKEKSGPQEALELIVESETSDVVGSELYQNIQKKIELTGDPKEGKTYYFFTIPLYDYAHVQKETAEIFPWGALLGLLILPLSRHAHNTAHYDFKRARKNLDQVAAHLNRFAWGFLRAEFNEILNEDYTGDAPLQFLEDHAGRLDGWEFKIPEKAPSELVEITKYPFSINLKPDLFSQDEAPPAITLTKRDGWTCCDNIEAQKEAKLNIARRIRHFYEQATLQHARKMAGQRSGALASAHDYSKDLNVLDSQLAQFRQKLQESKTSILSNLKDTPELEAHALAQFKNLTVPEERWLLRARFLMSHQRVETEGRLYEQPEWCLDLIRRGTRGALYRLIKLLVWHPLSWEGHQEKADQFKLDQAQKELVVEGVEEWARLFAYDEIGQHPNIDTALGGYLQNLFLDQHISKPAFDQRHPPPRLNKEQQMSENLLWSDLSAERWRPAGRLLPLLVFSLRAAFQHAWLTTFLKAASANTTNYDFAAVAEDVTLSSHEDANRNCYTLALRFPDPTAVAGIGVHAPTSDDALPWGDWERQIRRYTKRNLTEPWHISLSKAKDHFTITMQVK